MRLKMKVEMKEEIRNETSVIDRGPASKKVAVPLIAYLTTYLHTRPDCILVMQVVVVVGQGRPWSNDHLRLGLTHTHTGRPQTGNDKPRSAALSSPSSSPLHFSGDVADMRYHGKGLLKGREKRFILLAKALAPVL